MSKLNKFREKINLRLYDSKISVLNRLKVFSFFVSLIVISLLVYYHGYPLNEIQKNQIETAVNFSFVFYIFKFLIKFIYSFQPITFLRESKIEAIIILFLTLNLIFVSIFDFNIYQFLAITYGLDYIEDVFNLFIQGYILVIIGLELGKAVPLLNNIKVNPPILFILVFALLTLFGTILLLMPNMSTQIGSASLMTAAFTSLSACSLTGLVVADTSSFWTIKGQFVIILLIQLGAFNVVSFASMLLLFTKNAMGIRQQSLLKSSLNTDNLASSKGLFRKILSYTFFIEFMGFVVIWVSLIPSYSNDIFNSRTAFDALFHSVSAFSNAGFSTFSRGLENQPLAQNYLFFITISIIIIFGSLGFSNIQDIFSITRIRERLNKPWIHLRIDTRIAILSNSTLLLLGFLIFYLFERNNSLSQWDEAGKWVHAFFQSATTRSTGYSTVDFGSLHSSVLIVVILFMFVGGSSGSTAGGIKTNTFTLIIVSIYNTIRGRENLHIYNRTIPNSIVLKAISIFIFYLGFVSIAIFFMCITDSENDLLQISFEVVSAYCTTGLSMGITSDLSTSGKVILMIGMFIGRIGPLTMAYALLKPSKSKNYSYPKSALAIG